MKLSILIVNWNSKDYVRKCLRSLESCVTIRHQTIVVDGASYDGCGEMIVEEFPAVEFVQSPENFGFGCCNNLGAIRATGEYLLFLNPDTEVTPGAVEALLEVAEGDSGVGLVGARLLNTDGSLQTSCVQALPTPINQALDSNFLRRRFPGLSLWGNQAAFSANGPIFVEAVSGACMLIQRESFASVGGFCPDYFMYAEDMHLCWDVAKLGKRVVYQPASTVIHHGGGASTGEFSRFSCLEMCKALHRFIICRQGKLAGLCYRWLIGVSAIIRIPILVGALVLLGRNRRSQISCSIRRWWANLRWSLCKSAGSKALAAKPNDTLISS